MSVIEETRGIRKDLLALELREISARLDALDEQDMLPHGTDGEPASLRHRELMRAIAKLANLDGLSERIDRIEAREKAH
jgi:hypothetical protein